MPNPRQLFRVAVSAEEIGAIISRRAGRRVEITPLIVRAALRGRAIEWTNEIKEYVAIRVEEALEEGKLVMPTTARLTPEGRERLREAGRARWRPKPALQGSSAR